MVPMRPIIVSVVLHAVHGAAVRIANVVSSVGRLLSRFAGERCSFVLARLGRHAFECIPAIAVGMAAESNLSAPT
jgi:hypothetical protein